MPDGVVAVDKPAGWTSHDVVAKSRGLLGTRRSATPARSTRRPPACSCSASAGPPGCCATCGDLPKEYVGEIVLGTETTTLDAEGEVAATHDMGR